MLILRPVTGNTLAATLSSLLIVRFCSKTPLLSARGIFGLIAIGGIGGPADSTMLYTLLLYRVGFLEYDMGYASAMAWFLLVVIAAFTAFNFWLSKFWVFYDD